MKKLRVLAFVDYYLPGFKGGGPLVSVSRLIAQTRGTTDYWVFTRDRDLGDRAPYEGVVVDRWTTRDEGRVYYASRTSPRAIALAMRECKPDVVYLNSFFSRMTLTVLMLRMLGRMKDIGVVLAPRGEFSPGALAIKPLKKGVFIRAAKAVGLYRDMVWKPSTAQEMAEIRAVFGGAVCRVLAEIPARPSAWATPSKSEGECRFVFLSRISPKKNIEFAMECMSKLDGKASLDVYGPFESAEYEKKVRELAEGFDVRFHGPLAPALVPQTLREAHYFLFPTHGENFGHVIAESLAVGLPCVLSDTTPWSDIAECGAGWAIPLKHRDEWIGALQACVDTGGAEYANQVENVKGYYSQWLVSNPCRGSEDVFRSSRPAA